MQKLTTLFKDIVIWFLDSTHQRQPKRVHWYPTYFKSIF